MSCCICFSNRTGALILGWLEVIFMGWWFGVFLYILANLDEPFVTQHLQTVIQGFNNELQNLWFLFLLMALMVCLISFLSSIGLLAGVYGKNPMLISQWVIFSSIGMTIAIIWELFKLINLIEQNGLSVILLYLPFFLAIYGK